MVFLVHFFPHFKPILHPLYYAAKRTHVKKVEKQADGNLTIHAEVDGQMNEFKDVDCLLWAVGRVPQSDILNLPAAGIEVDSKGYIKVDEFQNTTAENITCVGDVCDKKFELTPGSLH